MRPTLETSLLCRAPAEEQTLRAHHRIVDTLSNAALINVEGWSPTVQFAASPSTNNSFEGSAWQLSGCI